MTYLRMSNILSPMRKQLVATPLGRRGLGPRQRFIIFLPDEIAAEVRRLASEGRRPINTQMEILVETALRQEPNRAVA